MARKKERIIWKYIWYQFEKRCNRGSALTQAFANLFTGKRVSKQKRAATQSGCS